MFNRPILKNYAKTGRGQQVATFPWLSVDFDSVATAPGFALGSSWYDEFGNEFQLKFNTATIALNFGELLEWETLATDADAVAAAPAPTVRQFAVVAGMGGVANALVGQWIYNSTLAALGGASTIDSLKPIKANTATGAGQLITVSLLDTKVSNLQNDADAYAAAPVAGDVVGLISNYSVTVFPTADAATSRAVGVATGACPVSNFCMTQVGGLALVAATGGVTPLVKGVAVAHSAVTAGNVIGSVAVAANSPGIAAAAYAAAVGGAAPVWLTLKPHA